jgi:hypothetical protein
MRPKKADFEHGLAATHKKVLGIHEPKGTRIQKANLARDRARDIFIKHRVTTKTELRSTGRFAAIMREIVDTIPELEHLRERYDPYADDGEKARDRLYDSLENWFVIDSLKKIPKTTKSRIRAEATSRKRRPEDTEASTSSDVGPPLKKTKKDESMSSKVTIELILIHPGKSKAIKTPGRFRWPWPDRTDDNVTAILVSLEKVSMGSILKAVYEIKKDTFMGELDIRSLHGVLGDVDDEVGPSRDKVSLLLSDANLQAWLERRNNAGGDRRMIYAVAKLPPTKSGKDLNTPLPLGRPFLNPLAVAPELLGDALDHLEDDDDDIPNKRSNLVRWPTSKKGFVVACSRVEKRILRQQRLLGAYIKRARDSLGDNSWLPEPIYIEDVEYLADEETNRQNLVLDLTIAVAHHDEQDDEGDEQVEEDDEHDEQDNEGDEHDEEEGSDDSIAGDQD